MARLAYFVENLITLEDFEDIHTGEINEVLRGYRAKCDQAALSDMCFFMSQVLHGIEINHSIAGKPTIIMFNLDEGRMQVCHK
jgi:hypothetical protein